jgi:hypothetical protein
MMRLSYAEHLDHMRRLGLFSDEAAQPEHHLGVLATYRALRLAWTADSSDEEILVFAERYAFSLATLDDARAGLNWALTTPIVDPCIPATRAQFARDLPQIAREAHEVGYTLLTDTFCALDGYPDAPDEHLLAVHSPIAATHDDTASYMASLTSHRRKKLRRLDHDFEPARYRFELSSRGLTDAELSFAAEQLTRRWGSADADYALIQTLWTHAVSQVMPERALFARLFERDRLRFVQTMIRRDETLYAQSIFKDEDEPPDGVAAFIDASVARALCGGPIKRLDPSCRATWEESGQIGVAKRASVNTDQLKPLLATGPALPDDALDALRTRAITGSPAR